MVESKRQQKVWGSAWSITDTALPTIESIYSRCCVKAAPPCSLLTATIGQEVQTFEVSCHQIQEQFPTTVRFLKKTLQS